MVIENRIHKMKRRAEFFGGAFLFAGIIVATMILAVIF